MPAPVSLTSSRSHRPSDSTAAEIVTRAARRRVPDRVADEVRENLADADRVDVEDRQVAFDRGRQR